MYRFIPAILILLVFSSAGCIRGSDLPSYPTGGEYGDHDYYDDGGGYGGGDYGGGGYDYNPPYDDKYSPGREAEGQWEGFMWEEWRSDGRPLSKKIVAMRVDYRRTSHTFYGDRDWVKMDVLIDGRPVASREVEITVSGNFSLAQYNPDIDIFIQGRFDASNGFGDIDLAWTEKFKNQWTGKIDEYYVDLGGCYEVGRIHHGNWAAAWDIFDNYGDEVFTLDDSIWESVTSDAIQSLLESEELNVRQPIQ